MTDDDEFGLPEGWGARLVVEVVRHHGGDMDVEELQAAYAVLEEDYRKMLFSRAVWFAWEQEQLSFDVVDGEIVLHTPEANPDHQLAGGGQS
jgi:hypothetical protein